MNLNHVRFDQGISESSNISSFFGENGIESLATRITNDNDSKGVTVNGTARLYRKFMKKRRELEVRYDINSANNNSTGNLYTRSLTQVDTSIIDQQKTNSNRTTSHYGTVSYFEPLSAKFKVNLSYLFEYGLSNQDKITYDFYCY